MDSQKKELKVRHTWKRIPDPWPEQANEYVGNLQLEFPDLRIKLGKVVCALPGSGMDHIKIRRVLAYLPPVPSPLCRDVAMAAFKILDKINKRKRDCAGVE